ncbi:MAG: 16S rRNA (cytidine(1402)-2'-O)-methyltransferase [Phaeodactylibacter sp.]|nr:16S rRNA (cytidine(1402)-2'-O)-methyltransferase [Phaeodactylibacter sp.]
MSAASENTGKLFIVPTPIGNLEDFTYRARATLSAVALILAEDTRTSKRLLDHYEVDTPLRSFHAHNEHKVTEGLVEQLLAGQQIALISDAGTPGISDPGFLLVRAAVQAGIEVECLPGATAFVPALVVSGFPCDKFHYEGFLPHKKGRQTRLQFLAEYPNTFVLYESPHRIGRCLNELLEHCGPEREVCICRELTKVFEEKIRGTLGELAPQFVDKKVKGEIVLVVQGKPKK